MKRGVKRPVFETTRFKHVSLKSNDLWHIVIPTDRSIRSHAKSSTRNSHIDKSTRATINPTNKNLH